MLINDYLKAVKLGDVIRQSSIMLDMLDEVAAGIDAEIQKDFIEERFLAVEFYFWQAIVTGDVSSVKRYTQRINFSSDNLLAECLLGRVFLLLGVGEVAEAKMLSYIERAPDVNEGEFFYLGRAYLLQEKYEEAFDAFVKAVEMRKCFIEAGANAVYSYSMITGDVSCSYVSENEKINRALADKYPILEMGLSDLNIDEECIDEVWNIPIFINSRDRVGCLILLVEWLLGAGYRNIIILDNESTYTPLLRYYCSIEQDSRVKVVRLRRNIGHKALWECDILEKMEIKTPYAYTDSDILPIEGCPVDFVQNLLRILRKYPSLKKAGPGIYLDDLPKSKAAEIRAEEARFYTAPIEDEVYYGPVDTTFAVYRNIRNHIIRNSARTTGLIQIRHLPWYYEDFDDMPEDEQYYAMNASSSSNVGRQAYEAKMRKESKI